MAEPVDATDLKSVGALHSGSSPDAHTKHYFTGAEMSYKELVKRLRDAWTTEDTIRARLEAADALEAQARRIEELERQVILKEFNYGYNF